jgi:myo-inositol 2-dehydrogenase / D-chiro-inositol 1-dehydrogenase
MDVTRRSFLKSGTLAAAALAGNADAHAGAPPLKVGLVGCGGRGTGAAENVLQAAPNVEIVALADAFPDRIEKCRKVLSAHEGFKVDAARCYPGLEGYRKLLESDVDYVLFCTPPAFRPDHLEAAVELGKHSFVEKPVAVDPVGVRRVIAAGKKAREMNLGVLAGTLYRYDRKHREIVQRIHDGQIGEIRSVRSMRLGGGLWCYERKPGQSDIEWQIRNWVYFDWLSGDFIVEMHIHQLDVVDWILKARPVSALGVGGRQARVEPIYGNIYDHFSVDYEYPGGVTATHLGRQMNGTADKTEIRVVGSKGVAILHAGVIQGENPWRWEGVSPNGYVQEHAEFIASVRAGTPINDAEQVAESTLTTILGREAAYTGRKVTREELLKSGMELGPRVVAFGPHEARPVPIPGRPR